MSPRDDVKARLQMHAVKHGEFELKCGRKTNVMVDVSGAFRWAGSLHVLGHFLSTFCPEGAGLVGGPRSGGDVLAVATITQRPHLGWVTIRDRHKGRGIQRGAVIAPNGCFEISKRLWLVEDVITSGQSVFTAAEHAVNEGYEVVEVFGLVDREEGGTEALRKAGYTVRSGFLLRDLL